MPYMPKKVSSWHSEVDKQRKKLEVKTKPDAPPVPIIKPTSVKILADDCVTNIHVDPLTGKEFRDANQLRRFQNTKKYNTLISVEALPFDPRICCIKCRRRFRDPSSLKRHMATIRFRENKCL